MKSKAVISNEEIKQFWTDAWAEMNVNIDADEEEILALKIFLSKVQAADAGKGG